MPETPFLEPTTGYAEHMGYYGETTGVLGTHLQPEARLQYCNRGPA